MTAFERCGLRLSVHGHFDENTMVFQHGLCGAAGQPADVFPQNQGTRLVTLECRGHGESEVGPLDELTIATFSDDLIALIEERAKGAVVLGGISMGAAISLRIAANRPELVRGLVLARPAWLLERSPANMEPNAYVGRLIAKQGDAARKIFEQSDWYSLLKQEAPDNLKSLTGFFDRTPVDITAALLMQISVDGPGLNLEEVKNITCPTLVLGCDCDFIHPLDYARALSVMIPRASFVQITAKATDADGYRQSFRAALAVFLDDLKS